MLSNLNNFHPLEVVSRWRGRGPRVVVSTAAFHARVRFPVSAVWKKQKMFLPHPRVKVSIVGSLRDRKVACSASDRQRANFESCVWRTVSSQSSHHRQEVLLAQFSLYVHKGGLKPDSFNYICLADAIHNFKWMKFRLNNLAERVNKRNILWFTYCVRLISQMTITFSNRLGSGTLSSICVRLVCITQLAAAHGPRGSLAKRLGGLLSIIRLLMCASHLDHAVSISGASCRLQQYACQQSDNNCLIKPSIFVRS